MRSMVEGHVPIFLTFDVGMNTAAPPPASLVPPP